MTLLDLARRAALRAGRLMGEAPRGVAYKSPVDLVTQVDLACESAIRAILEPSGIPVLGEEEGGAHGLATRWVVDPLDGTTNFVHGFPSWCCSIALQLEGELELGLVYDATTRTLYEAQRGRGARANGLPLRVSERAALGDALVASGFYHDRRERADFYLSFVKAMLERARGFRRAGAAALDLCHVASGRLDGYWEFGLNPWDVAAGTLLVREAGGLVSDVAGGALDLDRPRILASNGLVHHDMRKILEGLLPLSGPPLT